MSAAATLRAAVLAQLRTVAGAQRVADGAGAKAAAVLHVTLRDIATTDWGTKDRAGREARVGVTVRDDHQQPARIEGIAGAVEAALLALPRDLPGWRVVTVVPVRCAVLGEGTARWAAMVDVRVRMLEQED